MKKKLIKKKTFGDKVILFVLSGENDHCHNRC